MITEAGGLTQEATAIYEEKRKRKRDRILERDIPKQMSKQIINSIYVPKSFREIS